MHSRATFSVRRAFSSTFSFHSYVCAAFCLLPAAAGIWLLHLFGTSSSWKIIVFINTSERVNSVDTLIVQCIDNIKLDILHPTENWLK